MRFEHQLCSEYSNASAIMERWSYNCPCAPYGEVTIVPVHPTVKLQLSLCTLRWHIVPSIPNLYNRWRGVVRCTLHPDCHRGRLPVTNRIVGRVGPGAGLHNLEILRMWNWNKNIALTQLCLRYADYIQFSVLYCSKTALITVTIPWWWWWWWW